LVEFTLNSTLHATLTPLLLPWPGEHRDRALVSGPTTKLISFPEYVVTVLLLSIPEDEVHAVFDLMDMDGNGTLDAQEFLQVRLCKGQLGRRMGREGGGGGKGHAR
jgi:hypothetical protein